MKKTTFAALLFIFISAFIFAGKCVTASADEAKAGGKITGISYDPFEDRICVKTDQPGATVWAAVIKKEEGVSLAKKAFKSFKAG
ncbi:MAG: hypothetical protein ILP10_05845, partial [Lachnospiraceae bacterium]|nr:hypothetical protein [Lachnospiraceae bacterium]